MGRALHFLFRDWSPAAVFARAVLQTTGTATLLITGSWMLAEMSPAGLIAWPIVIIANLLVFVLLPRIGMPSPVVMLAFVALVGQAGLILFSTVTLNEEFKQRALLQRGITSECVVSNEPFWKNKAWRHELRCTDGSVLDYRTKDAAPFPRGQHLQMRYDPEELIEPTLMEEFEAVKTRGLAEVLLIISGATIVLTGLIWILGWMLAEARLEPRVWVERLRKKFPVWEISHENGQWSATIPTGSSITATSLQDLERRLTERSHPYRR
ncbi:hypothetical protein [Actinomadura sp. 6N118]|uniref:hypothetical protein n=1 Tax=Actinomadura sp. 6N118 TaxID=3375151 RepID=UPI0037A88B89